MSKNNERLLILYNAKKNLSNPPSYLETLKQLLELDGLLVDGLGDIPVKNEKLPELVKQGIE